MPIGTPAQHDAAKKELDKAKTKADVATVWKAHYGTIGHKALARMLLGLSPNGTAA